MSGSRAPGPRAGTWESEEAIEVLVHYLEHQPTRYASLSRVGIYLRSRGFLPEPGLKAWLRRHPSRFDLVPAVPGRGDAVGLLGGTPPGLPPAARRASDSPCARPGIADERCARRGHPAATFGPPPLAPGFDVATQAAREAFAPGAAARRDPVEAWRAAQAVAQQARSSSRRSVDSGVAPAADAPASRRGGASATAAATAAAAAAVAAYEVAAASAARGPPAPPPPPPLHATPSADARWSGRAAPPPAPLLAAPSSAHAAPPPSFAPPAPDRAPSAGSGARGPGSRAPASAQLPVAEDAAIRAAAVAVLRTVPGGRMPLARLGAALRAAGLRARGGAAVALSRHPDRFAIERDDPRRVVTLLDGGAEGAGAFAKTDAAPWSSQDAFAAPGAVTWTDRDAPDGRGVWADRDGTSDGVVAWPARGGADGHGIRRERAGDELAGWSDPGAGDEAVWGDPSAAERGFWADPSPAERVCWTSDGADGPVAIWAPEDSTYAPSGPPSALATTAQGWTPQPSEVGERDAAGPDAGATPPGGRPAPWRVGAAAAPGTPWAPSDASSTASWTGAKEDGTQAASWSRTGDAFSTSSWARVGGPMRTPSWPTPAAWAAGAPDPSRARPSASPAQPWHEEAPARSDAAAWPLSALARASEASEAAVDAAVGAAQSAAASSSGARPGAASADGAPDGRPEGAAPDARPVVASPASSEGAAALAPPLGPRAPRRASAPAAPREKGLRPPPWERHGPNGVVVAVAAAAAVAVGEVGDEGVDRAERDGQTLLASEDLAFSRRIGLPGDALLEEAMCDSAAQDGAAHSGAGGDGPGTRHRPSAGGAAAGGSSAAGDGRASDGWGAAVTDGNAFSVPALTDDDAVHDAQRLVDALPVGPDAVSASANSATTVSSGVSALAGLSGVASSSASESRPTNRADSVGSSAGPFASLSLPPSRGAPPFSLDASQLPVASSPPAVDLSAASPPSALLARDLSALSLVSSPVAPSPPRALAHPLAVSPSSSSGGGADARPPPPGSGVSRGSSRVASPGSPARAAALAIAYLLQRGGTAPVRQLDEHLAERLGSAFVPARRAFAGETAFVFDGPNVSFRGARPGWQSDAGPAAPAAATQMPGRALALGDSRLPSSAERIALIERLSSAERQALIGRLSAAERLALVEQLSSVERLAVLDRLGDLERLRAAGQQDRLSGGADASVELDALVASQFRAHGPQGSSELGLAPSQPPALAGQRVANPLLPQQLSQQLSMQLSQQLAQQLAQRGRPEHQLAAGGRWPVGGFGPEQQQQILSAQHSSQQQQILSAQHSSQQQQILSAQHPSQQQTLSSQRPPQQPQSLPAAFASAGGSAAQGFSPVARPRPGPPQAGARYHLSPYEAQRAADHADAHAVAQQSSGLADPSLAVATAPRLLAAPALAQPGQPFASMLAHLSPLPSMGLSADLQTALSMRHSAQLGLHPEASGVLGGYKRTHSTPVNRTRLWDFVDLDVELLRQLNPAVSAPAGGAQPPLPNRGAPSGQATAAMQRAHALQQAAQALAKGVGSEAGVGGARGAPSASAHAPATLSAPDLRLPRSPHLLAVSHAGKSPRPLHSELGSASALHAPTGQRAPLTEPGAGLLGASHAAHGALQLLGPQGSAPPPKLVSVQGSQLRAGAGSRRAAVKAPSAVESSSLADAVQEGSSPGSPTGRSSQRAVRASQQAPLVVGIGGVWDGPSSIESRPDW